MSRPKIFTAALLYSRCPLKDNLEKDIFETVKKTIQEDEILSQGLHLVCIDNTYTRELLQHNSSGLKIYNWPIFVVRDSEEHAPRIYPINLAPIVFRQVYDVHKSFQPMTHPQSPQIETSKMFSWNASNFKSGYNFLRISSGEKVQFISDSDDIHDLVEATPNWNIAANPRIDLRKKRRNGFNEFVLFDKPGTYNLISTSSPQLMRLRVEVESSSLSDMPKELPHEEKDESGIIHFPWNLTAFPSNGAGRDLDVRYGDRIKFTSTDNRIHNISRGNGRILVPNQFGLNETFLVDARTFSPGLNELACLNNPDRMQLRLRVGKSPAKIVRVMSKPTDLFEGMTSGNYDDTNLIESKNPRLKTFVQRRAARQDYATTEILDGMTDEF